MGYENNEKRVDSVYSQRVRAGKRRTYFFDVRETRGNDYYLTITESRKKFNEDGYDRHKIFLYKEDFNKFLKGITEAIDYVKIELMPDFDFDIFSHENDEYQQGPRTNPEGSPSPDQSEQKASDEAPTGIAAAATPELDSDSDKHENDDSGGPSDSKEGGSSKEDTSGDSTHRDEHVDKW